MVIVISLLISFFQSFEVFFLLYLLMNMLFADHVENTEEISKKKPGFHCNTCDSQEARHSIYIDLY